MHSITDALSATLEIGFAIPLQNFNEGVKLFLNRNTESQTGSERFFRVYLRYSAKHTLF